MLKNQTTAFSVNSVFDTSRIAVFQLDFESHQVFVIWLSSYREEDN
jgi:hypothetical protein